MSRSSTRWRPTACTRACQPSNPRLRARASCASRSVTRDRAAGDGTSAAPLGGWGAASAARAGGGVGGDEVGVSRDVAVDAGSQLFGPGSELAQVRVRGQGRGGVGGGVIVVGGGVRPVGVVGAGLRLRPA